MNNINNQNSKKHVIDRYYTSFYQDGKMYDDYLFGSIIYNDGIYTIEPTSGDEAYDAADKKSILDRILEEKLFLYDGNDEQVIITKENPNFLETYAALRSNMYGGLVIIAAP